MPDGDRYCKIFINVLYYFYKGKIMKVTVDKRVELINVIQHLANGKYKQRFPKIFVGFEPYSKMIDEYFGKFANHDAVKLFPLSGMIANTFNLPIYLALQDLDNNFVLNPKTETHAEMKKFVVALKDFADQTHFDYWFKQNQAFYDECIKQYSDLIEKSNFEKDMMWFYGKDFDQNINRGVVLMPSLSDCNGFVSTPNGQYCAVSSYPSFSQEKIHFTSPNALKVGNIHTLWHEFSHPIINPLVKEYVKQNGIINLENDITKSVGIYHGEGLIDEAIVEAVVVLFMNLKGLKKDADYRMKLRAEGGQTLIAPLSKKLEDDYIPNKDKFEAFSEYFPSIMQFLKDYVSENTQN